MDIHELVLFYIRMAEEQFGPMCSDWKFRGVEVNDMGPHLRYYPEEREVAISISEKVIGDEFQLHFQLSHEVCHLLYPTMSLNGQFEKTTVLNEGVSTYFSILAVSQFDAQQIALSSLQANNLNYFNALSAVSILLQKDQYAIKKLRAIEPQLNRIKTEHFLASQLDVPSELVCELIAPFE